MPIQSKVVVVPFAGLTWRVTGDYNWQDDSSEFNGEAWELVTPDGYVNVTEFTTNWAEAALDEIDAIVCEKLDTIRRERPAEIAELFKINE